MLLLHPAPTCPDAGLTFEPCTGGVFLPSTDANTPLAHVVVITCCNLRWWYDMYTQVMINHKAAYVASSTVNTAGIHVIAGGSVYKQI